MKAIGSFLQRIKSQVMLLLFLSSALFIILAWIFYNQNIRVRDEFDNSQVISWLMFNTASHQGDYLNAFQALHNGLIYKEKETVQGALHKVEETLGLRDEISWLHSIDYTFKQSFRDAGFGENQLNTDSLTAIWKDLHKMISDINSVYQTMTDSTQSQVHEEAMQIYNNEHSGINNRFFSYLWGNSFFGMVNGKFSQKTTEIQELTARNIRNVLIFMIGFFIVINLFWFYFQRKFDISIRKPLHVIDRLAQGELVVEEDIPVDEMGPIVEAANKLSNSLSDASTFAQEIGQGNFNYNYQLMGEKDTLGIALNNMRDDLKKYHEKEKIQIWSNEGYAKFSDILRNSFMSISEMGLMIISNMVKYLNANQGAIFLYNNETQMLDLEACYAYERTKYLKKSVMVGEGLVGQCYLERQYIYLTSVPDNYI